MTLDSSDHASEFRRTLSEATQRVESIIDEAEATASKIRADAEAEVQAYREQRQREVDAEASSRIGAMDGVAAPLVERIQRLQDEARQLSGDLDTALSRLRSGSAAEASPSPEPATTFSEPTSESSAASDFATGSGTHGETLEQAPEASAPTPDQGYESPDVAYPPLDQGVGDAFAPDPLYAAAESPAVEPAEPATEPSPGESPEHENSALGEAESGVGQPESTEPAAPDTDTDIGARTDTGADIGLGRTTGAGPSVEEQLYGQHIEAEPTPEESPYNPLGAAREEPSPEPGAAYGAAAGPTPVAYPGVDPDPLAHGEAVLAAGDAGAPGADPASEDVLLRATQLAVSGSSRGEIETALRAEFGLSDVDSVLDGILGPEAG